MSFSDINTLTQRQADTLAFTQTEIDSLLTQFTRTDSPLLTDQSSTKKQYEGLSKKCTQYLLHSDTLIEYLRAKRIPRGLRLSLRPTFCLGNKEFINNWFKILNKCSLDLIALTIQGIQTEIDNIKQNLEATQKKLEEHSSKEEIETFLEQCKITIDKYRQDTLQFKLKKFRRDALDYEEDRVYTWRERQPNYNRWRPTLQTTDSDSSQASSSSATGAPFLGDRQIHNRQRKGRGEARGGGGGTKETTTNKYQTRSNTRTRP